MLLGAVVFTALGATWGVVVSVIRLRSNPFEPDDAFWLGIAAAGVASAWGAAAAWWYRAWAPAAILLLLSVLAPRGPWLWPLGLVLALVAIRRTLDAPVRGIP